MTSKASSFPRVFGGNPVSHRHAQRDINAGKIMQKQALRRWAVSHWIPAKNTRE
jgi:hypothetical protein